MPGPIVIASLMREQGTTGVQTHVRAVLAWLKQQGRDVQLVTPFHNPAWQVVAAMGPRRLIEPVSPTASVWWYRHWHALLLQRALRRALRDGQPCTVYAQCPPSARSALKARVSSQQRVVMVVHFNLSQADEWADKGEIKREGTIFRSIRDLESQVLPELDGLVFVSAFMQQAVQQRIAAIARVPMAVVPNFVFDPGPVSRPDVRRDLIAVGTLEPRKNQRYAVEIIHAARQLGTELTLSVVGNGPDRAMLERYANELGVAPLVQFEGFVANAAGRMADHRACLHVAQMENLPLTLIEALSRGLPVFAPAVGGVPEVFTDGREGRQIPLDNAHEAASIIVQWLNDRPTLDRAATAARERFMDAFEAQRTAARLANFFEQTGP